MLRDDLLEDRFRLPGVRRDAGVPDLVVPVGAAERNAALEAQAAHLRLYSRLAKVWLYLKGLDSEELRRIPGTPTAQWVFGLSGVIGLIDTIVK